MKKKLFVYEWSFNGEITLTSRPFDYQSARPLLGTIELDIEPELKEVVKEDEDFRREHAVGGYESILFCVPAHAYDHKLTYKVKEPA